MGLFHPQGPEHLDIADLPLPPPGESKTRPFERDEMRRILQVAERNPMDYAMVLVLRYSGLRILDGIKCSRNNLHGTRLVLPQKKIRRGSSRIVAVDLPELVVEALEQFKPRSDLHWFWDGRQSDKDIRQHWYKRLKKLFANAHIPFGKPHMLRDTFAVENLLSGMEVKNVSELLGHSSVTTTEKHYLYWVRLRQVRLDEQVKRAHDNDPLLQELKDKAQKVRTFLVHKKAL
jgi:integrase